MQQSAPSLSLGDLLADERLGLALLTGSAEDAARPVLGAAVVEVAAPTEWLGEQWVLLTAGVGLEHGPDAGRALVRECDAAGITALGFGLAPVFDEVPSALLEEGAARGLPIFTVPHDTPFRDVVRFVDTALVGEEAPLFRRLSSLQRYVVDALREPEPERAVVERLARFLDAGVAVLGPDGEPQFVAGKAPLAALWRTIDTDALAVQETEVDGWHAVVTPLASPAEEPPRWLVLASRRSGFAGTLAKSAAETTAPLLAAMERLKEVVRNQEHAVKGALLEEALAPADARDLPALAARAAGFDVDFSSFGRVVLLRHRSARLPLDPSVLRHECAEALARAQVPHLLTERDGAVVALVQGGDAELRDTLGALLASETDAMAGIGRPVTGIAAVRHSYRDAQLALEAACRQRAPRMLAFEDFDLGTLLVSEAQPEWLGPKAEQLLSALHEHQPLHETLICWFEHDLDIGSAAAALHLHPNSLRHRLGRIEQLLGLSLRRPSTIADLHIALLVERTDGGRP